MDTNERARRQSQAAASVSSANASARVSFQLTKNGMTDGTSGVIPSTNIQDDVIAEFHWRLFVYLGALSLAAWNFMLLALEFFSKSFPGKQFDFIAVMVFQGMNLLASVGTMLVTVPFQMTYRITLSVTIGVLLLMPALAFISPSTFPAALFLVGILGLVNQIFSSMLFSTAAALQPPRVDAFMVGQGVIGLGSLVLMMLLQQIMGRDNQYSPPVICIFFGVCIALFVVALLIGKLIPTPENSLLASTSGEKANDERGKKRPLSSVLLQASPQILNVFLTFVFTFVVFPGVTLQLGLPPTIAIGIFQVCDILGRVSAWILETLGASPDNLWLLAVPRAIFVPLFMTAAHQRAVSKESSFLSNPVVVILAVALFALTNGWAATLAMMYGPQAVPNEEERVGKCMILALASGIFVGSVLAMFTQ